MRSGGSLFAVNAVARSLGALFGFTAVTPSRQRYRVNFSAGLDPALRYLNRPEELQVPLGAPKYGQIFWTNGYSPEETAAVLAHFEDGSAAVLRKSWGKGAAYLCGVSFHDVVLRNQVNRDYDAERHYVNAFEPGADVWLLLLRAWYEAVEPAAVRISTIPGGQMSVVLLSHDVDWEYSFTPALSFAKTEASLRTRSTFFLQTKYVSDANSKAFFFGKNLADIRGLFSSGHSIGSHSIIHSRGFNKFELGSGVEEYPVYQPREQDLIPPRAQACSARCGLASNCWMEKFRGSTPTFSGRGTCAFPQRCPKRCSAAATGSIPLLRRMTSCRIFHTLFR